ncbi:MAG: carboxypeptidase regulatory-like domain-containing protein [Muribaculaceae bacterium]|nr:carboxypeptidase regulatory-like domain-containing protein [Muribaculaceae bacterium]
MRIKLSLLMMLCVALQSLGATGIKGTVVDANSGKAISDANIMLRDQGIFVTTTSDGTFSISKAAPGPDVLQVVAFGYEDLFIDVDLIDGLVKNLGDLKMAESAYSGSFLNSDEFIFDEEQIADDDGMTQNVGTIQGANDDIFYQMSNYNFSTVFYKQRGLDNTWNTAYINGIEFNDPMRGSFSYGSLGGLTSSAFRSKSVSIGSEAAAYGIGNIGGSSNNTTYASEYAPGFRGNLSYTNSNYMLRAMLQYSTGLNSKGWAFSASVIGRWANEGVIEGTFYNSIGYAMSLQKVFNDKHSLNLSTWGAPTERATSGTSVQEAYDLAGSNLYNNSWGYFNGKKRSSRVIKSFDPSATLNWIFKPKAGTVLNTAIGFRHNAYAQSRLNYYGQNPAPDYYSKLPSYWLPTADPGTEVYDAQLAQYDLLTDLWRNDEGIRQINWDAIYQSNMLNRENFDRNPEYRGQSTTILEYNHSNVMQWMFNSYINHRLTDAMTLQGGLSVNYSDAHYYKTVGDLLGGEFWRDVDTYSERDFGGSTDKLQNDMRNPNRLVKDGDVFGYDYNIRHLMVRAWLQNQIVTTHWNVNYGAEVNYVNFMRHGNMQNGRSPENSYGAGERHTFDNASVKAGATYKLDGRNYFVAHATYGTRAPRPYDAYVSPRTKDDAVPGLKSERFLSGDIAYVWNYKNFRGSVTGFYTHIWDAMKHTGFYDYDLKSFMNYNISDVETEYKGVEIGLEYKIMTGLSVRGAANFSRYQYKNNPMGVRNYDNGSEEDVYRRVYLENYFIGCAPQQAYSVAVNYNIKQWFFEINANYMADNYYDLSFARHEEMPGLWKICQSEEEYDQRRREIIAQDKLKDAFVMNLSIGKVLYTKFGSVNFNLSVNNLLNNRNIQMRGWQDGKFDFTNYTTTKFPNKVAYAQGLRVFFNVGIRF